MLALLFRLLAGGPFRAFTLVASAVVVAANISLIVGTARRAKGPIYVWMAVDVLGILGLLYLTMQGLMAGGIM